MSDEPIDPIVVPNPGATLRAEEPAPTSIESMGDNGVDLERRRIKSLSRLDLKSLFRDDVSLKIPMPHVGAS